MFSACSRRQHQHIRQTYVLYSTSNSKRMFFLWSVLIHICIISNNIIKCHCKHERHTDKRVTLLGQTSRSLLNYSDKVNYGNTCSLHIVNACSCHTRYAPTIETPCSNGKLWKNLETVRRVRVRVRRLWASPFPLVVVVFWWGDSSQHTNGLPKYIPLC